MITSQPASVAAATHAVLSGLPVGVLPTVLLVLAVLCGWAMVVVGRPTPQRRGSSVRRVASGRQQNRNGV